MGKLKFGLLMGIASLVLGSIAMYSAMNEGKSEYRYTKNDFKTSRKDFSFIVSSDTTKPGGEWTYIVEGTIGGYEFTQRIGNIDGCRYELNMALSEGKLTYEAADWTDENLSRHSIGVCEGMLTNTIIMESATMVTTLSQHS